MASAACSSRTSCCSAMPRRCRPLLGTFVEIVANREESIEAAFDAVAQVHRLMSAHEPDSELSRINRFGHRCAVDVHEWTARVLERALYWARESGGAFDPVKAGSAALSHNLIPRHPDQPQPKAAHWTSLEVQGRSIRLLRPACIDLGGIAKGFAVDRAIDVLRAAGCESGLVNAGGDLRGFGRQPWSVTIVDPLTRRGVAEVQIAEDGLATSAGFPGEGTLTFHHMCDKSPRWISVTVLASTACDADALTKLVWAGGERLGLVLGSLGAKAIGITQRGVVEHINLTEDLAA